MKRKVLITGCSGQDGSYLVEKLLSKGYEVHGLVRRNSTNNLGNIAHIEDENLILHEGDITDSKCVNDLLQAIRPEFVYNMAAQSHVGSSFSSPEYTSQVVFGGACNIFEAVYQQCRHAKVYQASSSEQWGTSNPPQDENTPMNPVSPYAIAKTSAHRMADIYRRSRGLVIHCGILSNHESPRRGANFLTQKVAIAAANKLHIELGNLSPIRDWGYAPEYMDGIITLMEEIGEPQDVVFATGEGHSVEEFVKTAFDTVSLSWKDYVVIASDLFRPCEVPALIGNPAKVQALIGWEAKTKMVELAEIMVAYQSLQGTFYNISPKVEA